MLLRYHYRLKKLNFSLNLFYSLIHNYSLYDLLFLKNHYLIDCTLTLGLLLLPFILMGNLLGNRGKLFYTQKRESFSPNTLAQYFFFLYRKVGIEGASSHSGRRSFLTHLANKGTAIHILKSLAGHRNISTTAAYLYSSPDQLKAAVELV